MLYFRTEQALAAYSGGFFCAPICICVCVIGEVNMGNVSLLVSERNWR